MPISITAWLALGLSTRTRLGTDQSPFAISRLAGGPAKPSAAVTSRTVLLLPNEPVTATTRT
jgi:hypothetical protein